MRIVEFIQILSILVLGIIVSISDIKRGIIKNKNLLLFAVLGLILDGIYYGFFARDILWDFAINFVMIAVISLVLFYTHSFAGGDCKYCIVLGILYPANFYLVYGNSIYTLCFTIAIAILYGYFYLLLASLFGIISKKNKITKEYVIGYIKSFAYSFLAATLYISALNLLFSAIERQYYINPWFIRAFCLAVAWIVGKNDKLKKWYCLLGVLLIDIVLSAILKEIPISTDIRNYTLVFVLLICQMTIRTNLYENVEVNNLEKGMILSMFSSMLMQNSRVRGLPGISAEDLRSRLTEDEVESVKRWAKSREVIELTIVKKVPFALFISLGYITYFLLRSILQ